MKHGHAQIDQDTPTYYSWANMKTRCLNPNHKQYKDYGGRGIKVCDRWLEFVNFLADMGERPLGMELGRVDGNGNYEPNNCEWVMHYKNMHDMFTEQRRKVACLLMK